MGSRTDMIELGTPPSDNESMSMPQSCEDECTKILGRLWHFSRAFLAWFEVICKNQCTIKRSSHCWAKSEKTCGWDGEGIPISVIGRSCIFHWVPTPKSAEILLWLKGSAACVCTNRSNWCHEQHLQLRELRTGSHEAYAPFTKLPFMKCCSSLGKKYNLKEGFCESGPERNPCKMTASSPREPFRPGFVQDCEREYLSSIQGAFHEQDIQAAWAIQSANVVANTQYPAVVWTVW